MQCLSPLDDVPLGRIIAIGFRLCQGPVPNRFAVSGRLNCLPQVLPTVMVLGSPAPEGHNGRPFATPVAYRPIY